MTAIHLVERLGNPRRLPDTAGEWESGYWHVSHDTADRLVGGDLYLHSGQNAESHFGGRILGYRIHRDPANGEIDGRIVFRFLASPTHRGIRTPRQGWGNEKKIVWSGAA